MKRFRRSSGFTLTELMIVVVVIGILTAMAGPSFIKLIEKRRLMGAAEEVYSQFTFARNEAVKRSKAIYITFGANGSTTWVFGITDRAGGCDPTIAAMPATPDDTTTECSIDFNNDGDHADRVLYRFTSDDFANVSLAAPTFTGAPTGCATGLDDDETCFDSVRGTARSGTIDFTTTHYAASVNVNIIGRANLCTPAGDTAIPDYPDC